MDCRSDILEEDVIDPADTVGKGVTALPLSMQGSDGRGSSNVSNGVAAQIRYVCNPQVS